MQKKPAHKRNMTTEAPKPNPDFHPVSGINYAEYRSELADKYASPELKRIWSPQNRWRKARDVWVAVAEVQSEIGIVSQEEVDDLKAHIDEIDVYTINKRETDEKFPGYTGHDVMAARSQYADVAKKGGRILHLGLTSEDILSNVEVLLMRESFDLLENRLETALGSFADKILQYKDLVGAGYTHLQNAEPVTQGLRLATYARDLLDDLNAVRTFRDDLKAKGIKGPVGTYGSVTNSLSGSGISAREFEKRVMEKLGIEAERITAQTYPRKTMLEAVHRAAQIGATAHKFGNDVKILQSTHFDEWAEPRNSNDQGSSAMPFKRNPRHSEQVKGVARGEPGRYVEAWQTTAEVTLERGLEDSSGKRNFLPDSIIIAEHNLRRMNVIVSGLVVRENVIRRNFRNFAWQAGGSIVLSELPKLGADRQRIYDIIHDASNVVVDEYRENGGAPMERMVELVSGSEYVAGFATPDEIRVLFERVYEEVGEASEVCEDFVVNDIYPAIGRTS